MISSPTAAQLLAGIKRELRAKVLPVTTDAEALDSLEMVDALLSSIAIRCDYEIAWMIEEIEEIQTAAQALIESGTDHTGKVAASLARLHEGRRQSLAVPDVQKEYSLAGEVLSRSLECAMRSNSPLRTPIEAVLESRLAHETTIRGEFTLSGRT